MSSRRFVLCAAALFILGALPFLVIQPTAAASAGLSMGFSAPLEHSAVLLLLMLVGGVCALLPRDGLMLIPIAFVVMVLMGGLVAMGLQQAPGLRYFILGAVLCMGMLIAIAREKLAVLMLLVLASLGFHLGGFFMQEVPPIASPIYYLIGALLSLGMVLAISIAFGVTLYGDNEAMWEKFQQSPRFQRIRSFFL